MEEGQTVEIQETREPLREQGSIRALLELLEQQGMEQEKGERCPCLCGKGNAPYSRLAKNPIVSAYGDAVDGSKD